MGRGKLKETTKRTRALNQVNDWLTSVGGDAIEITEEVIQEPSESALDKIKEAEACLIYFSTKGSRFKEKICKTCGKKFAYRWEVDSISRCSVECHVIALEEIGLKWTPNKPQSERWGSTAPVVVPPVALEILKAQTNGSQEDQSLGTS